jgi:hypothetical protein
LSSRQRGNPVEYLLDRTLMRPRDLIAFLNECVGNGSGRSRLSWKDIDRSELEYSKKRLLALRDEWKPTFPGIDSMFSLFQGVSETMTPDDLGNILDAAALLPANEGFAGVRWMTTLTEPLWNGLGVSDWPALYGSLVKLLYDISFIGVGASSAKTYYSYEYTGYADLNSNLAAATHFAVHPAFRATLDIVSTRHSMRTSE